MQTHIVQSHDGHDPPHSSNPMPKPPVSKTSNQITWDFITGKIGRIHPNHPGHRRIVMGDLRPKAGQGNHFRIFGIDRNCRAKPRYWDYPPADIRQLHRSDT